jgi:hypothetical protein
MSGRSWNAIVLAPLVLLTTAGCATYGQQYGQQSARQVFYEVPCDMPGAFRADLESSKPEASVDPTDGAAAGSPMPANGDSAPPEEASRQQLCLAQADAVPRRYAGRAYGYYDNGWWPYGTRGGYFGFGIGLGRHHGGHSGGGHRGGHRGGGRH